MKEKVAVSKNIKFHTQHEATGKRSMDEEKEKQPQGQANEETL